MLQFAFFETFDYNVQSSSLASDGWMEALTPSHQTSVYSVEHYELQSLSVLRQRNDIHFESLHYYALWYCVLNNIFIVCVLTK